MMWPIRKTCYGCYQADEQCMFCGAEQGCQELSLAIDECLKELDEARAERDKFEEIAGCPDIRIA